MFLPCFCSSWLPVLRLPSRVPKSLISVTLRECFHLPTWSVVLTLQTVQFQTLPRFLLIGYLLLTGSQNTTLDSLGSWPISLVCLLVLSTGQVVLIEPQAMDWDEHSGSQPTVEEQPPPNFWKSDKSLWIIILFHHSCTEPLGLSDIFAFNRTRTGRNDLRRLRMEFALSFNYPYIIIFWKGVWKPFLAWCFEMLDDTWCFNWVTAGSCTLERKFMG